MVNDCFGGQNLPYCSNVFVNKYNEFWYISQWVKYLNEYIVILGILLYPNIENGRRGFVNLKPKINFKELTLVEFIRVRKCYQTCYLLV